MTPKTKQILIIVLILIVAFVGYQMFFSTKDTGTSTLSTSAVAKQTIVDGAQLYSTLKNLLEVKLEGTIFSNETFKSLVDYGVTIQDQPVGRPNPFAPIGNDSSLQAAATTSIGAAISQPRVR